MRLLRTVCASPGSIIVGMDVLLVNHVSKRGVFLKQRASACEGKACRSSEDTVVAICASILDSSAMA
jgi:hypothetical protein